MRRWAAPLVLVIGSTLFALLVGEVALRALDVSYYWSVAKRPHPQLGWTAVPGAEGWQRIEGKAKVRINASGFRDRDHAQTKPAGSLRIAVLGDSFTEAVQVPIEQTYWRVLQQQLQACPAINGRSVEVLGFGVSGYSSAQQLQTWRHVASRYAPDIVILGFYAGNDVQENARSLDYDSMRPYFVESDGTLTLDDGFRRSDEYRFRSAWYGRLAFWLLTHSRLLQVADEARDRWRLRTTADPSPAADSNSAEPWVDNRIYSSPEEAEWERAWAVTERILVQLNREVAASGARLWVATLSTGAQVHPSPEIRSRFAELLGVTDLFYPERRIAALGEDNGFAVLNLAPELQFLATMSRSWLHGFDDGPKGVGHWNATAHHLAGQIIAERLCADVS